MNDTTETLRHDLRVGLVDTGLDVSWHPQFGQTLADYRSFLWQEDRAEVAMAEGGSDFLGHGSALAATVLHTAPGVGLLMAQVFSQQWRTRPAQVAAAISWLCESGAHIINLSLGLKADRSVLRDACERALASGVILVASSPAMGDPVFPAAYQGVIRATGDARCDREEISWLNSSQADVGACVRAVSGPVAGASVGAACISGHIARYLRHNPGADRKQVLAELRQKAHYFGPERR